MQDIRIIIKNRREELLLTQQDVADAVGVSEATVSRWESGDIGDLKRSRIAALAKILKLSPSIIVGIDDSSFDVFSLPGVLPLPQTIKRPRLGAIACGEPILAVENIECYDNVPAEISCDFTLICKGDSMIGARIHDGDVVYIRQQEDVEEHEIAAVIIDEEGVTLKRVRREGHFLFLLAENPAFPTIIVNGEHTARIIGKAVGFTSVLR